MATVKVSLRSYHRTEGTLPSRIWTWASHSVDASTLHIQHAIRNPEGACLRMVKW